MGANETGGKEMGRKEVGAKETAVKETKEEETGGEETGGKATGAKAPGAQDSQEMGGKGDMLMGKREMDNMLPGDTTEAKCNGRDPMQELL